MTNACHIIPFYDFKPLTEVASTNSEIPVDLHYAGYAALSPTMKQQNECKLATSKIHNTCIR